ncbi:hypothetical protein E2C01_063006 [Portunus trituberculatus]|uniref:Uncharacterized protein n=1 Tax=Portunus trituberculatus TaxID=210409 RepID=A0A5B7HFK8_PORTR|nr:hypothetical protein [Portunus trituberculatus]
MEGAVGDPICVINEARPRGKSKIIEMPLGLRQLGDWSKEREFSGLREERANMKRFISWTENLEF